MGEPIPGKGELLTRMALFWFDRLRGVVPNHLTGDGPAGRGHARRSARRCAGRSMLVKRLQPIPVEAVVRGYLAGSGWNEYQRERRGLRRQAARRAAATPARCRSRSSRPPPRPRPARTTRTSRSTTWRARSARELAERIRAISIRLYTEAAAYALGKGIIIADTKFEFGLDADGTLTLMDEVLTPDSSRYWPMEAYVEGSNPPSYDKQFVRDWLEAVRIEGRPWNKQAPAPALPADIVAATAARYQQAWERLAA